MITREEIENSEFLSEAVLKYREDGFPIWDVQYLLAKPEIHIETDPEKVKSCPFVKRQSILDLNTFKEFKDLKPSDFTTNGVLLSYKWETKDNPDVSGKTLQFVQQYLEQNPSVDGCFIDFMCLPQSPRSESQDKIFKSCLQSMNVWYATYPVIVCNTDERYFNSSWCICENMLAHQSQNSIYTSGNLDSEALMIKFICNRLHQQLLMSQKAILKVCKRFKYMLPNIDEELSLGVLAQTVLANIMLRIAASHATNGSDKKYIVQIMRAFTENTLLYVREIIPRGMIEDVRFEEEMEIIAILDNGIEVKYSDVTTNPRDSFMGLTIMRENKLKGDLSYLFN